MQLHGKRFKQEILEIEHNGKTLPISWIVLKKTGFFRDKKSIYEKILPLNDVGLGYVKLGSPRTR
jgi:excinuclease ABC subunit A